MAEGARAPAEGPPGLLGTLRLSQPRRLLERTALRLLVRPKSKDFGRENLGRRASRAFRCSGSQGECLRSSGIVGVAKPRLGRAGLRRITRSSDRAFG